MTNFEQGVKNDIILWAMSNGVFITKYNFQEVAAAYWKDKLK